MRHSITSITSWGRLAVTKSSRVAMNWRHDPLPDTDDTLLPYGNGRSYGDSCLNHGGTVLDCRGLKRFIRFDPESGILRAEAGVLLADILRLIVPRGWFLPVTPGTRYVTLGGAVANDVHGKNHHRSGSFGHHVRCFELHRSTGERLICSADKNAPWFAATIGGLGLTGLISWVEIALKPIPSAFIRVTTTRFRNLSEFMALTARADHEYTVAWVDCLARGKALGRGVFMGGDHAPRMSRNAMDMMADPALSVPCNAPGWILNKATLSAFNGLYYGRARDGAKTTHFAPFFYPLDGIGHWNRLYGKAGFYQYQCVLPPDRAEDGLRELLGIIAASGQGSFLAVLKGFGDMDAVGMLSFPRPGVTLALDFPNRGTATTDLLDRLDQVVDAAGGALYPAKDARMSAYGFARYFPAHTEFTRFIDPRFSSDFWRRVIPEDRCDTF